MGLDISSYVVYGKITPKEVLTQHHKARACNHEIDESKKFCSECGQPVWVQNENTLLDSLEDNCLSYFYSDYSNQKEVIVGFQLGETDSHRNNNETTFYQIKKPTPQMTQELIAFFSQRGIVTTDTDFAMHVFQHYSY